MTFLEYFLRLLPYKPVQAFSALYWRLTGRKVRARNRLRVASADLGFPYAKWIKSHEVAGHHFSATINAWEWRPHFCVLLHASGKYSPIQLERSVKSLEQQIYPFWHRVEVGAIQIDQGIARAGGDYVVPLRIGDAWSETGLFRLAESLQTHRGAPILFGDHDHLDENGRRSRPWFKPRWNREMFLAQDYLADAVAIETSLARRSVPAANVSEMLLAATSEAGEAIVHVPYILCHVAATSNRQEDRIGAVRRHLGSGGAACGPGPFGTIKVTWPLPDKLPLVSIIVPTRDKLELLGPCLKGVLERTSYPNFEVLIVDNGSVEPRTAKYFQEIAQEPRVRLLRFPRPYNFGAINNFAAQHARGSFLCLLNNDTEVVGPDWLTEMMRYAVRPEIGAVGAKLLYDDGSIQHAGVVVGIGGAAGHVHRFLPDRDPGYFRQAHVSQYVTAVTAACLTVNKRKFQQVGGLDETELPVAFNDVDLCLKLQAAGWRNVYVPHAVLLHHESKTRGNDISRQNIGRFRREVRVLQRRWDTERYDDPQINPNFDRGTETFVIRL